MKKVLEWRNKPDPSLDPYENVARCDECGGVLPPNHLIYKGKDYCKKGCLPNEAEVATEAI